jgi:hypothetical protein
MARTAEGTLLTRRHYVAQLGVRAATSRDVMQLWGVVDPTNLTGTYDRFARAATTITRARHATSSGVAARYQEDFRRAEKVAGRAAVKLAAPLSPRDVLTAIRGAGLSGIINSRKAGFSAQAAARNGLVKVLGQTALLVLGGGRDTIIDSVAADPKVTHWQRVTSVEPCAFCAMLATRGAAFSADTADFEAHDHCSCTAEAAYEGSAMPLTSQRLQSQWQDVTAGLSGDDALNAFRRSLAGGDEATA